MTSLERAAALAQQWANPGIRTLTIEEVHAEVDAALAEALEAWRAACASTADAVVRTLTDVVGDDTCCLIASAIRARGEGR